MTPQSAGAPTFIGGLMKSGTSLLRKLLGRHPRLFAGLETHWFSPELTAGFRDPATQRARWLRQFYDVDEATYAELVAGSESIEVFLDRFLSHCARREGKARWVEKTPDNVLHLGRVWDAWPDACVLHVVRDPRDVYASWAANEKGTLEQFVSQARRILESVERHDGPQLRHVRYESLVTDTKETLDDVVRWLGEAPVDGLADYAGDRSDYQAVLEVTGKKSATAESLAKPIFESSIGRYGGKLTADEVRRIESELPEYASRWGYWT